MPARFSYIDARGKEVEIGGTAQLLQRIRLGAIDDSTQLYDAAGDRWAPAGEHPIYQELASTVGEEGPTAEPLPGDELSHHEPGGPEEVEEPEGPEEAEEPESEPAPEDDERGFEEMDFGLTLSAEEEGPSAPEEAPQDPSEFDLGDLTLAGEAPGDEAEASPAPREPEDPRPDPFAREMGPGGGESPPEPPEEAEEEWETGEAIGSPDGEEMELESPLDHLGVGDDEALDAGGFEEEDLVSGAAGEDWSRSDDESWGEEPDGGTDAPGLPGGPPEPPTGETGEKRARPARPPARRSSSAGSLLTLLLIVAVLAAGGWVGYRFFLAGPGEDEAVVERPPDPRIGRTVPAELRGPMVSVADETVAAVADWIEGQAGSLQERPPQEWLDGIYLAHASEYPEVEAYFSSLGEFIDRVRNRAPGRFLEAYEGALDEADLSEDQRARLRVWVQEDLEWSRFQRDSVYRAMADVVGAALDLHALLVEREEDIGYELLEAVPSDEDLQSEIDGHVDRLTSALDELNALGQVTTPRFVEILRNSFRRTMVPGSGSSG